MIALTESLPLEAPAVSKRSDNRRENLRRLIDEHDGPKELALKLGYRNASFLVQMAGPNPTRDVTEKSARSFEQKLGLEDGSLDWPPEGKKPTKATASRNAASPILSTDTSLTLDVIKLVGQVSEEQGINLPPMKFADVVALAISDAAETGKSPSKEHLKRLLALLK